MHFTQEDYIKIENWLHRNSVKDTEFQEALPFTGKEIVTVVQDGHNRKVNIQEFINQLYKHGVEDFLNVTNTYRANNITLKEAIRLIPAEARKEGQVITFLNTDGNWEIYQFIGKLNQWNNPTLWNNPFDWEKLIVDSILPDEEDLTKSAPDANGNAYLSLKDRNYEPDKYSGLGRKILRRRVVEIEDPIYGTQEKNLLLQADFAEDNTVYVVRYDFTLNGQDITLPDNSYIEYEGGSISDGNIIDRAGGLNRVVLKKNIVNGKNILTQDMINKPNTIYEIRHDFDLQGAEITIPKNCVLDFQGGSFKCKNIVLSNNVIVKNGKFDINGQFYVNTSCRIEGCYFNRTTEMSNTDSIIIIDDNYLIEHETNENIIIKDCVIEYVLGRIQPLERKGFAIELYSSNRGFSNVHFNNIQIDGYFTKAIYIHTTNKGWITDITFDGIIITRSHNAFVMYSDYTTNSRIQMIRIVNSSIQGATEDDGYLLDCYNARNIYVINSVPWDWNDHCHHSAYKFYSNTGYVYVDSIVGGNKNYDFEDLTNSGKIKNNLIHINSTSDYNLVNPSGYSRYGNYLGDIIDLTSDVKMSDFAQLPNGIYYLPEIHDVAKYLGLGSAQGGVLICNSEYNSKFIIYIGNVKDPYKRREVAFMSILTYQSFDDEYVKDYWIRPVLFENTNDISQVNPKIVQFTESSYLKATPMAFKAKPFSNLPNDLGSKWLGETAFDSVTNRPVWWTGSSWKDVDGYTYNSKKGTTAEREQLTLYQWDAGYCYFDTTINKPIWWVGTKWVDATGVDV